MALKSPEKAAAWALMIAYALELGLGGALLLWALLSLCGLGGVFSIRRRTSSSRF
jgi:hypothetical protein